MFVIGQTVRLVVPENERLHGATAKIKTVHDGWADVETKAAATGQFRAAFEEMVVEKPVTVNGAGYTGEVCSLCGGTRMVRNGTCQICQDCGSTSGCS